VQKNSLPSGQAEAALIRAMAQAQLGRPEWARRTLAEADRYLAQAFEDRNAHEFQQTWKWRERVLCQVLLREAAEVVLDPTFPADPFAH
jgi:hypothetical protein